MPLLRNASETLEEHLLFYSNIVDFFYEYPSLESDFVQIFTSELSTLKVALNYNSTREQLELAKALDQYRGNEFASLILPLIEKF
jgi:hypothetical protein